MVTAQLAPGFRGGLVGCSGELYPAFTHDGKLTGIGRMFRIVGDGYVFFA